MPVRDRFDVPALAQAGARCSRACRRCRRPRRSVDARRRRAGSRARHRVDGADPAKRLRDVRRAARRPMRSRSRRELRRWQMRRCRAGSRCGRSCPRPAGSRRRCRRRAGGRARGRARGRCRALVRARASRLRCDGSARRAAAARSPRCPTPVSRTRQLRVRRLASASAHARCRPSKVNLSAFDSRLRTIFSHMSWST